LPNCSYDVIIYDAVHQNIIDVTQRNLDRWLMLCLMNEDHYDVVYKKEHIQNAGFCQCNEMYFFFLILFIHVFAAIIYNILYENVFNIPKVQDIVHGMLYEKEFVAGSFAEINNNLDVKVKIKNDPDKIRDIASPPVVNVAPFPFKVAKALDPTMYRNIEYDSWTEVRRGMFKKKFV
jgi:OTU domain-containing protein 4